MNLKYLISLSFTCTLLAACGATGTQFSGITPPSEGQGKIYVYRTASMKGAGIHYNVHANDNLIGHIRNGGYISAELPPGDYEIWAKTEAKRGVIIPLKADEIQCIKASVGFGALVGRPKFVSVPLEQCEVEFASTVQSF